MTVIMFILIYVNGDMPNYIRIIVIISVLCVQPLTNGSVDQISLLPFAEPDLRCLHNYVEIISASNGTSQFPEPRSGSAYRRTTIYYRCDQ